MTSPARSLTQSDGFINPHRRFDGGMVPNWLLSSPDLGHSAKLCYAAIGRRYQRTFQCAFPTHAEMANEVGLSKSRVTRCIAELEAAGVIKVTRSDTFRGNEYVPMVEDLPRGAFLPRRLSRDRSVSPGAKLVYARLAQFYDEKKRQCAYPRVETLAAELGLKERQTRAYIEELKSIGLLHVTRRGRKRANEYRFPDHQLLRPLRESATPSSSIGADAADQGCGSRRSGRADPAAPGVQIPPVHRKRSIPRRVTKDKKETEEHRDADASRSALQLKGKRIDSDSDAATGSAQSSCNGGNHQQEKAARARFESGEGFKGAIIDLGADECRWYQLNLPNVTDLYGLLSHMDGYIDQLLGKKNGQDIWRQTVEQRLEWANDGTIPWP